MNALPDPVRHLAQSHTVSLERIKQVLPHRYPFLLIDRIIEVVPGSGGTGIKNVTCNEPFFQHDLPTGAVMPGVLIIEALAQTAGVLVAEDLGAATGLSVLFRAITDAKFRRPVIPGDQLRLHCLRQSRRGKVWHYHGTARVDGAIAAEANFTAWVTPNGG
jgi:3-hydroxyacyl-[acyl-carrier-protein] dehydratase